MGSLYYLATIIIISDIWESVCDNFVCQSAHRLQTL